MGGGGGGTGDSVPWVDGLMEARLLVTRQSEVQVVAPLKIALVAGLSQREVTRTTTGEAAWPEVTVCKVTWPCQSWQSRLFFREIS